MSTDANLHRLPDIVIFYPKFLVPLAGIIQHPYPTDSSDIQLKQRKDSFYTRKTCILELLAFHINQKQISFEYAKFKKNNIFIFQSPTKIPYRFLSIGYYRVCVV